MNRRKNHDGHRLVIFSPHLDDAAYDVCDHITLWKLQGWNIEIVTVFTGFGNGPVSRDARISMGTLSFSPQQFEAVRKNEDIRAMKELGVPFRHLNFIDACFRVYKGVLIYPDFRTKDLGRIHKQDHRLLVKLEKIMDRFSTADRIYVPMGIGGHVDHIIVRTVAQKVFSPQKLGYYVDFPYALSFKNWRPSHFVTALIRKKSVIQYSERKWSICLNYETQTPMMFSQKPHFPETVFE